MKTVFCKDCVYWDIIHKGSLTTAREGRCRRHAPTPMAESIELEAGTIWPATFDDDWCGEGKTQLNPQNDEMILLDDKKHQNDAE